MAVAKSYQDCLLISEVYTKDNSGRQYIKINFHGREKEVRWYPKDEKEKETITICTAFTSKKNSEPWNQNMRQVMGFGDRGFITIFKGNQKDITALEWFRNSGASYTALWGWYFPSDIAVPVILPSGIEAIELKWDEISENDEMYSGMALEEIVDGKLYPPSLSQWTEPIGARIHKRMVCTEVLQFEGRYGKTHMYILEDENGNAYTWTTSSKKINKNDTLIMRGTVKDYKIYKNIKQTVLTSCRIS